MFEEYKKRGNISESFYNKLVEKIPETQNPERWRQLLDDYRSNVAIGEDPFEQEEFVERVTEEIESIIAFESEEVPVNITNPIISRATDTETSPSPLPATSMISARNLVRYHIQIAANTQPLDRAHLRRIYTGEKEIHHFREDQWEKYYIGHYHTFAEAREILRQIDIEGAFIIAFAADQKLIAYKARQVERMVATSEVSGFHTLEHDHFRIQIAASRRPLSLDDLKKIYRDVENIGVIFEDDWFKYSIPAAPTLQGSWRMSRNTNVEGAYVVRYQNGRRLPLR